MYALIFFSINSPSEAMGWADDTSPGENKIPLFPALFLGGLFPPGAAAERMFLNAKHHAGG